LTIRVRDQHRRVHTGAASHLGDGVVKATREARMSSDPDELGDRSADTGQLRDRVYRNVGMATPIATLQTMAWACDQGDVATARALFVIDDSARPEASAVYAAMPAEARAEWKSVEAAAAAIIVSNGIEHPYPSAEVLALAKVESVTAGRVRLLLPGTDVTGLVFQQTTEGWKYVISKAVVDA